MKLFHDILNKILTNLGKEDSRNFISLVDDLYNKARR